MELEHLLDAEEKIELITEPQKGLMLHANDLFKILFGVFFFVMTFSIGLKFHFGFLIFGVIGLIFILNALYIRYSNTNGMKYVITNRRVLFLKDGTLNKQKEFKELNEITYENSGNDRGYIILGAVEPLLGTRGVNLTEDKYVLDNLTNYTEVSALLKKLSK